jgi:hypothetical protein
MGLCGLTMKDLARAYVRFMIDGAETDAWAIEKLSELARNSPALAWDEIQRINELPMLNEAWQQHIHAAIGCGPLEDILVLHEAAMLFVVIEAAKRDGVLQRELSAIYEGSVSPSTWAAIQSVTNPPRASTQTTRKPA